MDISTKHTTDSHGPSGRERILSQRNRNIYLKYRKAVEQYAETDKSLKDIAEAYGVSSGALGNYLRRYWRELVLRRHRIHTNGKKPQDVKIIGAGKESINAHLKYKDAVAACKSMDYIDQNLSQIARQFDVSGTALGNFMRVHYMDVLVWREKQRQALGIGDTVKWGAHGACMKRYAKAVELYRNTDMTVPEVAERCHVSPSGFSQHLRFYHKDVLRMKRERREAGRTTDKKPIGAMLGNGHKNRPAPETERKYAQALVLYRKTSLTMREIVSRMGVSEQGFRFYVHKWHEDLVQQRAMASRAAHGAN